MKTRTGVVNPLTEDELLRNFQKYQDSLRDLYLRFQIAPPIEEEGREHFISERTFIYEIHSSI